ncbi:uncharacterized protein LOC126898724 isoform X2 [Daktulosphaira vitifoliae]|nr:uncharacterized protein LOC126898724 isoform X2 [Daktulosphaira vitifoliae]
MMLTYSGWKVLNDVYFVKYRNNKYYLRNLIEKSTIYYRRYQIVRGLSVHLGCTYTKVLKSLSIVIDNVKNMCEKQLDENDMINGCICTEELVYIISMLFVPMVTLMKGAMDALDLLHDKPLVTCDRIYYTVGILLGRIEDILDKFLERSLSHKELSSYPWTLNMVDFLLKKKISNVINKDNVYCDFVPYDTNYLWNKWLQEYNNIINQGTKLVFIKFVTRKVKDFIRSVIIEKYFQLGFKFDPITEETFIPKESIELELEFKVSEKGLPMILQIENH